jgi:hypothetical protein
MSKPTFPTFCLKCRQNSQKNIELNYDSLHKVYHNVLINHWESIDKFDMESALDHYKENDKLFYEGASMMYDESLYDLIINCLEMSTE